MRNVTDRSVEKIKTHILCPTTFPENRAVYEAMWNKNWWSRTGHRLQYNTAHELRVPDNYGYRHT